MKTLSAEELHEQGVRYYNGNGVKKDDRKAIECFEQAIAIGNLPQSKRSLGHILLGDGLFHSDASNLEGLKVQYTKGTCGSFLKEQ